MRLKLAQRILRFVHPSDEADRMRLREALARAAAEAEDVTRTIQVDATAMRVWLARRHEFNMFSERCEHRHQNGAAYAICKHPKHPAAKTGIAQCDHDQCPILTRSANHE